VGWSSFSLLPSHSRLTSAPRKVWRTTQCFQQGKRRGALVSPRAAEQLHPSGWAVSLQVGAGSSLSLSLGQQRCLKSLQRFTQSCECQQVGMSSSWLSSSLGKVSPHLRNPLSATPSTSSCWSLVDVAQRHAVVTRIQSTHQRTQR